MASRGSSTVSATERIMAAMPAILEQAPLHPRHALGVEVALQLRGEAELPKQVAPGGPVELRAGQVGHEQWDLAALELVEQVEHQAGIAGETRQVVHDDRRHLARAHRREQGLVAVARRAEARW